MEIKVLDFTGKWCSTCTVLDRIMESEIIPRYKNKVKFIKVDIEKENLTRQYSILSVPTLIFLKDGKEMRRKSGLITKKQVIEELNKMLK